MVCKMGCASALTAPNRCPSPLSLRAPARTRASQQSPGLLLPWRVALFESRNIVEQKKQGKKPCFLNWSGLRDSPGALLRAPARTRALQQSPGLLLPWRVALFESRNIVEQKKQGKKPCFLNWSGLRDSNSLPPPWQGGALPDELNPQTIVLLYPAGAGLSSPFFAGGNKKCRPLVGITIGTTTYR